MCGAELSSQCRGPSPRGTDARRAAGSPQGESPGANKDTFPVKTTAVAFFIVLAIAVLVWTQYRDVLRRRDERARYVADILPLLDDPKLTTSAADFPTVTGRYHGHEVRIEPHTDTIAVRKLPSLWLLVTVREALPFKATLGVMMRPRNVEYWSPFDRLEQDLERPAAWPEGANIRTDGAERGGELRRLIEPHLDFLRHPKGKEILITPKGVRFTWLAEEGERSAYMVLRQAKFTGDPLDPELVRGLLERCLAVAAAAKAGAA